MAKVDVDHIEPLTPEELAQVELKRHAGESTAEEDLRYYVTIGIDEDAARFQVGIERREITGDVDGGYRYE